MSRNARKRGTAGLVVIGLVAISFVAGAVFLGPRLAWSIANSAVATTVLDGLAEGREVHDLPVVDLWFEEAEPDGSNGLEVDGRFALRGIHYPIRVTQGDHGEEGQRTYRVVFADPPEELAFHGFQLFHPASTDMLQEHMALWIAGDMGVTVPYDALVFLRVNGRDGGVMELREQVASDLEQGRGRSPLPVTVIAALEDGGPIPRKVNAFLADTILTRYALRDSIAQFVNMDACLRFLAAKEMLNATTIETVWVSGGADGRLYPVITAASLMDGPPVDSLAGKDELLSWIMEDGEWRTRRDRYVQEARERYVERSIFTAQWQDEERALMPSLLQDRHKKARIVEGHPHRYGYSVRRAVRSSTVARNTAIQYWVRMGQ